MERANKAGTRTWNRQHNVISDKYLCLGGTSFVNNYNLTYMNFLYTVQTAELIDIVGAMNVPTFSANSIIVPTFSANSRILI